MTRTWAVFRCLVHLVFEGVCGIVVDYGLLVLSLSCFVCDLLLLCCCSVVFLELLVISYFACAFLVLSCFGCDWLLWCGLCLLFSFSLFLFSCCCSHVFAAFVCHPEGANWISRKLAISFWFPWKLPPQARGSEAPLENAGLILKRRALLQPILEPFGLASNATRLWNAHVRLTCSLRKTPAHFTRSCIRNSLVVGIWQLPLNCQAEISMKPAKRSRTAPQKSPDLSWHNRKMHNSVVGSR